MTAIMKSEPTPSDREVLTGLVERVTYRNAENGRTEVGSDHVSGREFVGGTGHCRRS